MAVRRTSAMTYNTIRDSGLLSKRRWEAYDALYRYGPATASELIRKMVAADPGAQHRLTKDANKRLSELVRRGVAYEVRERECSISGHIVIEFDVTDSLPTTPPRRPSKLELARERIAELEAEVDRLNRLLAIRPHPVRTPVRSTT